MADVSELQEDAAELGAGGRVVRNAAWVMSAELIGKVASFILVVVLARDLGARSYGYFNFGLAFVPLFLQLARWGVDTSITRIVSADPEELSKAFVNGFAIRLTLSVTATVVAIALCPLFIPNSGAFLAVAIIGVALLFDEIRSSFGAFFVAFERMRFNAISLLINRVLSTVLAVLVVWRGGGLVAVAVTYLIGSVGAMVTSWIAFTVIFPPVRLADLKGRVVAELLRDGAAYGVAAFLNMAVFRIDAVILEALKGPVAVGIYGVAYRFFEPLLFITWGISQAAFPRLVKERTVGGSTKTYDTTLAALVALYLPMAVGILFTAHRLVEVLFTDRYETAVAGAMWLTGAAAFYGIANFARLALISAEQRSLIVWVAAGTLALNVALNLLLIPHWSYTAAAAVTLVTEVVEAGVLVVLHARLVGPIRSWRLLLTAAAAAALMGLTLLAFGLRGGRALLVAPAVYFAALYLIGRTVAGDEVRALVRSVRRRPAPA
ncbi:MAG TPA: flippase [Acidimicrobiales bacterium]|nr:flippase [Acidimicrobiales bacterium]